MVGKIHYASAHLLGHGGSKREIGPGLVRLQHCRHGSMIYFPHDTYIGGSLERYGEYVEEEIKFLLAGIPVGGFVIEAGANIGCHTVPIARHVGPRGHVLCFEPQRVLHQMLCGNLALNALWNVTAERVALGAEMGVAHLPTPTYEDDGNFGGVALSADGEGEPVPVVTVDSYTNLPACHLLKIDVEGMELEVLRGAAATIARFRPLIYCENDRPERGKALVGHLRGLGYDLYWHKPPLYSPDNYRESKEDVFPNLASFNMACIPHEEAERVKTNLEPVAS